MLYKHNYCQKALLYFGIPIAEDWCINVQMGMTLYVYQACWLENFANLQLNMRRIEGFKTQDVLQLKLRL